jgi:ribosomal protein S18 acetylase RimI-like enzyme
VRILDESAQWMRERGLDHGVPGQWPREWLAERIAHGETYLGRRDGVVVGTVSLEWADEIFWPGAPSDAGYIHRLHVGAGAHGERVGEAMLEWSERQIVAEGRNFARLDTVAKSAGLRRYYESRGYMLRGERAITQARGTFHAVLYEKSLLPKMPLRVR